MYKLTNYNSILRLDGSAHIPMADDNTDYQQYLQWVSEGNTPEPADPLPPVIYTCSPWQIRKALNELNLRADIELAVKNSTDIAVIDGWEFATEFRSNDPFVISMGAAIGKTEEETSDLIKYAATL